MNLLSLTLSDLIFKTTTLKLLLPKICRGWPQLPRVVMFKQHLCGAVPNRLIDVTKFYDLTLRWPFQSFNVFGMPLSRIAHFTPKTFCIRQGKVWYERWFCLFTGNSEAMEYSGGGHLVTICYRSLCQRVERPIVDLHCSSLHCADVHIYIVPCYINE